MVRPDGSWTADVEEVAALSGFVPDPVLDAAPGAVVDGGAVAGALPCAWSDDPDRSQAAAIAMQPPSKMEILVGRRMKTLLDLISR
jgi:hypothetical protein